MCCGASYTPSSYGGAAMSSAWAASSGGATDFYAVLPRGETQEYAVGSYAEAVTATARGGGMRRISAAEAEAMTSWVNRAKNPADPTVSALPPTTN